MSNETIYLIIVATITGGLLLMPVLYLTELWLKGRKRQR